MPSPNASAEIEYYIREGMVWARADSGQFFRVRQIGRVTRWRSRDRYAIPLEAIDPITQSVWERLWITHDTYLPSVGVGADWTLANFVVSVGGENPNDLTSRSALNNRNTY